VGTSSANSHETTLVHLGYPCGLKGLLHMLNATVIPTKVSYNFYFYFSRIVICILLEDEQNLGVGVLLNLKLCYFYLIFAQNKLLN